MQFDIDADGAPSWFRLQPLNRSVPPRAQSRPRPTDPLGAEPKQYHLSTGLAYADQATGSLQLPSHGDLLLRALSNTGDAQLLVVALSHGGDRSLNVSRDLANPGPAGEWSAPGSRCFGPAGSAGGGGWCRW